MNYPEEKISVVIPVYNIEKYLEKSVRSVMDQTYRNLEIICVNDGSTDGSPDILRKLAAEDSRIVVIDKPNGGLGDARNAGMRAATAEWISFVDSDDTLAPDTYEKVSEGFAHNPDLIHFGVEIILEENVQPVASDERYYAVKYNGLFDINDSLIAQSDVAAWNKLFRKSVIEKSGIEFEPIWYEDFSFTLKYMFSANTIFCLSDKLYRYLRRQGSIMSDTFKCTPRAIEHVEAWNYVSEYLISRNLLSGHEKLMSELFLSSFFFAIRFCTPDVRPRAAEYSRELYNKYEFLAENLECYVENGNILFEKRRTHHFMTYLMQRIFFIGYEHFDYVVYKVVRILNLVVYKRLATN